MQTNNPDVSSIIRLCQEKGRELAKQYGPQLAEEYRTGSTQRTLAKKYSPDWELSQSVAENVVGKALELLLDEDERAILAIQHVRDSITKRNKFWPVEKKAERVEKVGLISYQTPVIQTDLGTLNEGDYYSALAISQKAKNENSGRRRKIDWKYVAERTNQLFGHNRTARELTTHYHKIMSKRLPSN